MTLVPSRVRETWSTVQDEAGCSVCEGLGLMLCYELGAASAHPGFSYKCLLGKISLHHLPSYGYFPLFPTNFRNGLFINKFCIPA